MKEYKNGELDKVRREEKLYVDFFKLMKAISREMTVFHYRENIN